MADEPDDLLNPEEIEALLSSVGGDPAGAPAVSPQGAAPPPAGREVLEPREIEALLQQRLADAAPAAGPAAFSPADDLLRRAEADLAAAVAPHLDTRRGIPAELGQPASFQFEAFDREPSAEDPALPLHALDDVELDLRIELGRTELRIEEVTRLKEGSVVPLDKLAGDPVDILVNGRLIARGEVLVLNDNFCVRVAEILTPDF